MSNTIYGDGAFRREGLMVAPLKTLMQGHYRLCAVNIPVI